jgi:ABC-type dipeptide/oligopeptide/nickel transport system permease subunit
MATADALAGYAPPHAPQPVAKASASLWTDAFRRLVRNRMAMFGLGIILSLVVLALFGPSLAPYGYNEQRLVIGEVNQSPGWPHVLGTDDFGRDVFSRILYGARTALSVGVIIVGIDLLVGVSVGALAGYFGGWVDNLFMRLTDVMFAFPGLLFAIMIVAVLGPGLLNVFIALGVVSWPGMARLVRGQALSIKQRDYVEAARAVGGSARRIILTHVLPNCLGPVVVSASLGMGSAILAESSLSFIGIGVQAPAPSWGSMINEAMNEWRTYPYLVLAPGAVIAVVVFAFNFLGDGLNDALNPRHR